MAFGTKGTLAPSGHPVVGFWRRLAAFWLDMWLIAGATIVVAIPLFARLTSTAHEAVQRAIRDVENWLRVLYGCIVHRTQPPQGFFSELTTVIKRDLDISHALTATLTVLVVVVSVFVTYVHVIRITRKGRSLADSILGLYKVTAAGNFLSLGRAAARCILFIVVFVLVKVLDTSTQSIMITVGSVLTAVVLANFLWPLWDDAGQTLLDKVTKTYVVHPDRFGIALRTLQIQPDVDATPLTNMPEESAHTDS